MAPVLVAISMLCVLVFTLSAIHLVRWLRRRRSRRRVMPRRMAADDRSTPLRTTPRVTTPRAESEGDTIGNLSPPSEPRTPRWSPVSTPTQLSAHRIAELQPADEEHALAFAVEQSLSGRISMPSPDEEARQQARAKSLEESTLSALLALPTQPWTPALARIRDQPAAADAALDAVDGLDANDGLEPLSAADGDADECSMCMDAFAHGDVVKLLKCRHYFHRTCIDDWFTHRHGKAQACPVCAESPLPQAPES